MIVSTSPRATAPAPGATTDSLVLNRDGVTPPQGVSRRIMQGASTDRSVKKSSGELGVALDNLVRGIRGKFDEIRSAPRANTTKVPLKAGMLDQGRASAELRPDKSIAITPPARVSIKRLGLAQVIGPDGQPKATSTTIEDGKVIFKAGTDLTGCHINFYHKPGYASMVPVVGNYMNRMFLNGAPAFKGTLTAEQTRALAA